MPSTTESPSALANLTDLTRLIQTAEGFQPLLSSLQSGHSGAVEGAWGSSSALAAAALAQHAPGTLLVVIAFPRDLDGWAADLASFADRAPVIFPAWDHLPDDETLVDETAGQRLRVLKQLQSAEPPRLLLTTMQALVQPVPDRKRLEESRRVLRAGEQVDPDALAAWLVERAYRRTEAVELPGEFSRRGGILDVYSPDADAPFRLEFFGDEVESVRRFAPDTQRSLGEQETVELLAADIETASAEMASRASV